MRPPLAASSSACAAWLLSGLLLAIGAAPLAESRGGTCAFAGGERSVFGEEGRAARCLVQTPPYLESGEKAAGLLFGVRLDLNRASSSDLEALPGIGPQRAAAIAAARVKARFRRVSDLERVPGIGPRTLDRLRPFVRVGGPQSAPSGGEGVS